MKSRNLKVLYLFNGPRAESFAKASSGESPKEGFWGMLRLSRYGIDASYVELEQVYPKQIAKLLRKYINIYFVHVQVFWKIFRYDIVFTSSAYGTQLIRTLLSYLGIRKPLWVMHDFGIISLIGGRRSLREKVLRWVTSRASGIVTVTRTDVVRLQREFPHLTEHIKYIPFGVDLEFFKPNSAEAREFIIFTAGFDPDRDWKTFISASRNLDVLVNIETRPERILQYLPLPSHFKQSKSNMQELALRYAQSSIFVLPLDTSSGVNDAMGCTTIMEAMASGCSIIATDTPTIASYITNGETGLLVPEGDVDALHTAIVQLLQDDALRVQLGKNARSYAETHLDAEKCTEKLAVFFRGLMLESGRV